jgi:hypothetical protein
MPFVQQDGTVVKERSMWRASIVSDTFWGILNLIMVFFQTLVSVRQNLSQDDCRDVKQEEEEEFSRFPLSFLLFRFADSRDA